VAQVFRFLKQSSEVRDYLRHFGSEETDRFAIIKVRACLHSHGAARLTLPCR
jgi:hypothetical protein